MESLQISVSFKWAKLGRLVSQVSFENVSFSTWNSAVFATKQSKTIYKNASNREKKCISSICYHDYFVIEACHTIRPGEPQDLDSQGNYGRFQHREGWNHGTD